VQPTGTTQSPAPTATEPSALRPPGQPPQRAQAMTPPEQLKSRQAGPPCGLQPHSTRLHVRPDSSQLSRAKPSLRPGPESTGHRFNCFRESKPFSPAERPESFGGVLQTQCPGSPQAARLGPFSAANLPRVFRCRCRLRTVGCRNAMKTAAACGGARWWRCRACPHPVTPRPLPVSALLTVGRGQASLNRFFPGDPEPPPAATQTAACCFP